jgi:uncharacterized SAM-binding protein YcdF (DUF218 family)
MTELIGVMTALLFSPLLFAMLLAAGIWLAAAGRRKASLWLLSAATVLLLAFSTGAASRLLLRPLEDRYPPWSGEARGVDVVVVLGGGVREAAPDEGGRSAPSDVALTRLVAGLSLSRRLGTPLVVSGGLTWQAGDGETEADVAARVLERLGLPASMVIREGKSRTTWENALGVARLVAANRFRRVALVTSAWHMPRAMLAFRRAGIDCVPAPTGYLAGRRALGPRDFMPGFQSLQESALALREYLGLLDYSLRR